MENYSMELDKLRDYKDKGEFLLKQLELVPPNLHMQGDWVPGSLDGWKRPCKRNLYDDATRASGTRP